MDVEILLDVSELEKRKKEYRNAFVVGFDSLAGEGAADREHPSIVIVREEDVSCDLDTCVDEADLSLSIYIGESIDNYMDSAINIELKLSMEDLIAMLVEILRKSRKSISLATAKAEEKGRVPDVKEDPRKTGDME